MVSIERLNNGSESDFVNALGDVFEHSPWLVTRTAEFRPFCSRQELITALISTMDAAEEKEKLALIRAHPDLAGKAARAGDLTNFSQNEQSSAGLDQLSDMEYERFVELNEAYKVKFGFPFIIAVLDHDKDSILAAFSERLKGSREMQIDEAIKNIGRIVTLRILTTVTE